MKAASAIALASALAFSANGAADDRTITRVVKLLQGLLDKSKADGDEMRTLYGKYKCYCDTNEAEKKESIESLGKQIALLGSQIEELQAKTGGLSKEVGQLDADMAANKQAQDDASALRGKEKAAFDELKADSDQAIDQMDQAIKTLSEVGADQTLAAAGADHDQMMAGFKGSLVSLRKTIKQALISASAFSSTKQVKTVESFLQGPFTGTYTAASGEVVGILKNMRDTFKANLAAAIIAEGKALEAHGKFMKIKEQEFDEMKASYDEKQGLLGDDDEQLAAKKDQKTVAETQKGEDESFLESLVEQCTVKAKQYDERTLMRRQEEAALAEAVSILNSDAAFATFGKVDATKSGATGFLQRIAIHQHASPVDASRMQAQRLLSKASERHWSPALAKVVALLKTGNPFATVLEEIKKMLIIIEKEGKADAEQLAWCNEERTQNDADLATKNEQIISLTTEIDDLEKLINGPETGLKFQIQETETSLTTNSEAQTFQTAERKEANVAYQTDIGHLVDSTKLLENAISVLSKYYAKIEQSSLVQEDPAPPATWEGNYKGQSEQGGGAIGMLEFILKSTKEEEATAHKDENDAQIEFEDSMTQLKDEEGSMQETLARLQKELAEAEQTLIEKTADEKNTQAAAKSLRGYLLEIKPGCDFITAEFDTREANRATESEALNKATELLKATPAYQSAEASAHTDSLGDCADTCKGAEEHVKCKACLAKTSVPGYCAGHAGTEGC